MGVRGQALVPFQLHVPSRVPSSAPAGHLLPTGEGKLQRTRLLTNPHSRLPNPSLHAPALFDFDHTITTCDSYGRFLRKVATPAQVAAARWQAGPWVLGFRMGVVPAAALRARVTRLVFSGRSLEEMDAHGAEYARAALPGMLRGR